MQKSTDYSLCTDHGKEVRRKRVRNVIISIIVGGAIVWFLLKGIKLRKIPGAIGSIPLSSLLLAFLMYTTSVYLKAVRFKMILRTGISLRRLFPIVSLYMFFANILPMRTGELSYVYLLKKQTRTPGTKSFASLIVGGIADAAVILVAVAIVGWYLREALAEGMSHSLSALGQKAQTYLQMTRDNLLLLIIVVVSHAGGAIGLLLLKRRRRGMSRQHRVWKYMSIARLKILEVGRELANTSFDVRLLGVVACSIAIIAFRFSTQWYLVRSMEEIAINIWELSFALLFGVLFSLIPVHGPAGFGTVELPWVAALTVLNVSENDATISGFSLHIIIIMYCIVLGLWGTLDLRFLTPVTDQKSEIENV